MRVLIHGPQLTAAVCAREYGCQKDVRVLDYSMQFKSSTVGTACNSRAVRWAPETAPETRMRKGHQKEYGCQQERYKNGHQKEYVGVSMMREGHQKGYGCQQARPPPCAPPRLACSHKESHGCSTGRPSSSAVPVLMSSCALLCKGEREMHMLLTRC